jgi:hypothetical protein
VAWLYLKSRQSQAPERTDFEESLRREMRSLERYIETKVDLLLAQVLAQKPPSLDIQGLAGAIKLQVDEHTATTERMSKKLEFPPAEPAPLYLDHLPQVPQLEEEATLTAERRLARLLDSSGFLQGVWPDMNGPHEEAAQKLRRYLAEDGLSEPIVQPFPSLGAGASNHWLFLAVSYRAPQADCRRFLIPCNYSRYDPLVHDHLFQVLGAGGSVDYFVRELRRCALLEANGELEGFIPKSLVVKKGEFVV